MTISSFVIVLFIFILSGLILFRPIIEQKGSGSAPPSGNYDVLLAEKERLYSIIEELDLSLDLGKISPEDHTRSRAELLHQAAGVLAELDQMGGKKKPLKTAASSPMSDDELEKMIQARRDSLRSETLALCPKCGEQVSKKDQYCSHCGESL